MSSTIPSSGVIYYAGPWRSGSYPGFIAHGSVAAQVDYGAKTAKILLRYEGMFLKGTQKKMETRMESDGKSGSVETYVFHIKGGAQRQNIQFVATYISADLVEGKYTSFSPSDSGTYEMKAITAHQYQAFEAGQTATGSDGNNCVVS